MAMQLAFETVTASSDRPVVHSDRGGHYRMGYSPDNAACEGFFGRLKTELFYSRNWLSTTIEEFVAAVDSYIRWYNEARIKISLGFRSPIEHRKNLGLAA